MKRIEPTYCLTAIQDFNGEFYSHNRLTPIANNAMLPAGWISVKDDSPKSQTHVWVWIGGLVNQPVKHFYTSKGKWINMETIVLPKYYEVEFWMPLAVAPACR